MWDEGCGGDDFKVGERKRKWHEFIKHNVVFGELHVISFDGGYLGKCLRYFWKDATGQDYKFYQGLNYAKDRGR